VVEEERWKNDISCLHYTKFGMPLEATQLRIFNIL